LKRVLWPFVLSVAAVGVLFLFVFPARTYLGQRHDLAAASARLQILSTENKNLTDQAAKLHNDAEIERLARDRYGLVRPGEEAYAILPSPPPPTTAPPAPTAAAHRPASPNWASKFMHGLL